MTQDLIAAHTSSFLLTVLYLSAPILLTAVAIGLTIGLLQAVTQIQDQTLPQAVKLLAVLVIVIIFGAAGSSYVARQAEIVFTEFPRITR